MRHRLVLGLLLVVLLGGLAAVTHATPSGGLFFCPQANGTGTVASCAWAEAIWNGNSECSRGPCPGTFVYTVFANQQPCAPGPSNGNSWEIWHVTINVDADGDPVNSIVSVEYECTENSCTGGGHPN